MAQNCPRILQRLSPALHERMHGKACFNFTQVDEALSAGLAYGAARQAAVILTDFPIFFRMLRTQTKSSFWSFPGSVTARTTP